MKIQVLRAKFLIFAAAVLCGFAIVGAAQTTTFTYQGRFTDASVVQPTNGVYNMSFKLFDAAAGGNQIGANINIPAVSVVNGIFTVPLDYTAAGFDGTARFLEITVTNVVLSPRQEITNAPYAITAQNALTANRANDSNRLGGIAADQYVTGQVVRSVNNLTNNVTLAAGANITITPVGNTLTIASTGGIGSFIDNSTVQQPTSNFNISGGGTVGGTLSANIVNSTTNFRIGGATVFSTPNSSSVVAGLSANHATFSADSTFFGYQAGAGTTSLFTPANTFIGSEAGRTNSGGANNSFVGRQAGLLNSSGSSNSFFGSGAGKSNTTASDNSFFGNQAGLTTTGEKNTFFGASAGSTTTVGTNNTLFGFDTKTVNGNRNVIVGADANAFGSDNVLLGYQAAADGSRNTVIGSNAAAVGGIVNSTAIGNGASVTASNRIVLGTNLEETQIPGALQVIGKVTVATLGTAGSTSLCRNASLQISTCTPGNLAEKDASRNAAAFDALQIQNAQMRKQLEQQQANIEAIKQTVCAMNPAAGICGN